VTTSRLLLLATGFWVSCAAPDATSDESASAGGGLVGFTDAGAGGLPGADAANPGGTRADAAATDAAEPPPVEPRPDAFIPEGPTEAECAPATPCGRVCVDLTSDPQNCGACGRTCVVPEAIATCVAGECATGACLPGFSDANGSPDDGCEAEVVCAEGEVCATACGTEGRLACDGAEPACTPPDEQCNGVDDDCDGACDEGPVAGCRVPVHRGVGDGHLYTTDLGAVQAGPFRLETEGYFHLYRDGALGMRPVFLCRKGDGKRFLTSDQACEIGVAPEATLGFWAPDAICGAVPLYRLYSPASNDHFYTTSAPERDNAVSAYGYVYEFVAGHVWPGP
jgi:hypothetical protein